MLESDERDFPIGPAPLVVSDPIEVAVRIAAMDLTIEVLHNALLAANLAASACSELDPAWYEGSTFNAVATRTMREQLIPRGWFPNRDKGVDSVVSPDSMYCIIVTTGDDAVGDPERPTSTKYTRGPAVQALALNNLELFPLEVVEVPSRKGDITPDTKAWFFLIRRDENGLHGEFNRPLKFGADGRVSEWEVRLILPSIIDGPEEDGGARRRDDPPPAPELDFAVKRR